MTSILTIIQQQDEEYDRLHALYEEAKQCIENATTPQELEAAATAFHPIQQAFLRNREQAIPTEVYQIIASYLDRRSRACLAECDKHLHYQVIYGKYSGRFVWSEAKDVVFKQEYPRHDRQRRRQLMMTPLLHACYFGCAAAVRTFLSVNDCRELLTHRGKKALHLACAQGHENVVDTLLSAAPAMVDVNECDANSFTPLYYAAKHGHLQIVKRLLTAGPSVLHAALRAAVSITHTSVIHALLEAHADVNYVDDEEDDGRTALHWAAWSGAADAMNVLLNAGAHSTINHQDHSGVTPLLNACMSVKSAPLAIVLLNAGADPNLADTDNRTPLMRVCERGYFYVARALIAAKADVTRNESLSRAHYRGHASVVDLLMSLSNNSNTSSNSSS